MVSSFHPHSMCKKVERVTTKNGCTSCTKRTISFEVSGFHTETRLLQWDFIFLNLFELHIFVCSKCTIQSHIINFQPFLISFVIFHAFTYFLSYMTLKMKSTTNELWKCWKLAWYHHFTHIACVKKLRGLQQKLDALRVQNGQSFSKYHAFERELMSYKGISFFELIWTPYFLCVQNAPFKGTSQNFHNFWLHLVFFVHLLIFFWASWPWNWKALQMNSENDESWHIIIISPT